MRLANDSPSFTPVRSRIRAIGPLNLHLAKGRGQDVGGFSIRSPRAPWAISDKVNATRLMILDAAGRRRLLVNPSCKRVIRSFKNLEFKPGLSVPDPASEHGHMADAVGYACIAISKGLTPWRVGNVGFSLW